MDDKGLREGCKPNLYETLRQKETAVASSMLPQPANRRSPRQRPYRRQYQRIVLPSCRGWCAYLAIPKLPYPPIWGDLHPCLVPSSPQHRTRFSLPPCKICSVPILLSHSLLAGANVSASVHLWCSGCMHLFAVHLYRPSISAKLAVTKAVRFRHVTSSSGIQQHEA